MIRKLIARLIAAWFGEPQPVPPAPPRAEPGIERDFSKMRIAGALIERSKLSEAQRTALAGEVVTRYEPPPGVIPAAAQSDAMALDSTPYDYINELYFCGDRFRGYPFLAMLSQQPDYRKISETIAKQMTRKWIKVSGKGDGDKSEKIAKIEKALERFKVRDLFRQAAELDGFFGRGQIYVDVKKPGSSVPARDDADELQSPLLLTENKITKGSLIGFNLVEPMWTYPSQYNSQDPLNPTYYKPRAWYVMGKVVHASRLLMFISRPVPDILKASYNFGGLSMSQLAEPAINNWLRTRDSVSDMVHSYSLSGIATNMSGALQGDKNNDIFDRADLFNNTKDNRGLLLIDKDTEEFFQFNTPLSGLHELQAQAQEQPAAVSNIPLVFLLGITPNGMNATSEGEIEVFYTYIATMQETLFRDNLKTVMDVIQLNEFGAIDDDITTQFVPLSEMTPEQLAEIENKKADTDSKLIASGVIDPDEARDRLIADPNNDYHTLEPNKAPGINLDDDSGGDDGNKD